MKVYGNLGEILKENKYRGERWQFVNGGMDLEIAGDTFVWNKQDHTWSLHEQPSLYGGYNVSTPENCNHKWTEIQLFTSVVTECSVCGKDKD